MYHTIKLQQLCTFMIYYTSNQLHGTELSYSKFSPSI